MSARDEIALIFYGTQRSNDRGADAHNMVMGLVRVLCPVCKPLGGSIPACCPPL